MDGRRRHRKEQKLARERARATGESYASALAHVRSEKEARVSQEELPPEGARKKIKELGEAVADQVLGFEGGRVCSNCALPVAFAEETCRKCGNKLAEVTGDDSRDLADIEFGRRLMEVEKKLEELVSRGEVVGEEFRRLVVVRDELVRAQTRYVLAHPTKAPTPRSVGEVEAEIEALLSGGAEADEDRGRLRELLEEKSDAVSQEELEKLNPLAVFDEEDDEDDGDRFTSLPVRDLFHEFELTEKDRRGRFDRIRGRRAARVGESTRKIVKLSGELDALALCGLSSRGEKENYVRLLSYLEEEAKSVGHWDHEHVLHADDGTRRKKLEVERELKDLVNEEVTDAEHLAKLSGLVREYVEAVTLEAAKRRKIAFEQIFGPSSDRALGLDPLATAPGGTPDWMKLAASTYGRAAQVLDGNDRLRRLAEATKRRHSERWGLEKRVQLMDQICSIVDEQLLPVLLSMPVDPHVGFPQLLGEEGHILAEVIPSPDHRAVGLLVRLYPPDSVMGYCGVPVADGKTNRDALPELSVGQLEGLLRSLSWILTGEVPVFPSGETEEVSAVPLG